MAESIDPDQNPLQLNESPASWIETFPLLRDIEDRHWRTSLKATRTAMLSAGEPIFNEGDCCEFFIMLASGVARIYKDAGSGRQITLYRVTPGTSCAMTTSCLLSNSKYPANGIAEKRVAAILLPAEHFRRCLVHSMDFRRFVFSNYGSQISDLVRLTTSLSFNRV